MPDSLEPRPSLPIKTEKPWGSETLFALGPGRYAGKILIIHPGHRTSAHYHEARDETLLVIDGICQVTVWKDKQTDVELRSWHYIHIAAKTQHRLTAVTECIVLEVSTPEMQDHIRVLDDYSRVPLFMNGLE